MMKIAAVIFACALSFNAFAQSSTSDASSSDKATGNSALPTTNSSPSLAHAFGWVVGKVAKGVTSVAKDVGNGLKEGLDSRPTSAVPVALAPVETRVPVAVNPKAASSELAAVVARTSASNSEDSTPNAAQLQLQQLQQRFSFLPFFGKAAPQPAAQAVMPTETTKLSDKVSSL